LDADGCFRPKVVVVVELVEVLVDEVPGTDASDAHAERSRQRPRAATEPRATRIGNAAISQRRFVMPRKLMGLDHYRAPQRRLGTVKNRGLWQTTLQSL
jgi:hypothetical protein